MRIVVIACLRVICIVVVELLSDVDVLLDVVVVERVLFAVDDAAENDIAVERDAHEGVLTTRGDMRPAAPRVVPPPDKPVM